MKIARMEVKSIASYKTQKWVRGIGKEAEFETQDEGWLVCLDKFSFIMQTEPPFKVGSFLVLSTEVNNENI